MDITEIYERQVSENRLSLKDIKRLFSRIKNDIFDTDNTDNCVIWSGGLSSLKHKKIKRFPVMFFGDKKRCVKRLIYKHFVKPIDKTQYISMKCKNSLCVNTKHMICKKYKIKVVIPELKIEDDKPSDAEKFIIRFD
jgi:hypothetical protein